MKHSSFWSLLIIAFAVSCTALPLSVSNAWAQEEKAETPAETPAAEEAEKPAEEPAPAAAEETPKAEEPAPAAEEAPKAEAPAPAAAEEAPKAAEAAPAAEEAPKTDAATAAAETTAEPTEAEAKAAADAAAAEKAAADAAPVSTKTFTYVVNTVLMFVCAVLVLMMQGGFALVEVGLNASKNAANILAKNAIDLCIGALLFMAVGFGLMYPGYNAGGYYGFSGFGLGGFGTVETEVDGAKVVTIAGDAENLSMNYAPAADFMFQVAFAATAATIVSGAVAGRMSFAGYLIYTAILTGFVYPVSGMWKWGYGWLDAMGFQDFAGSIIVHAVGGFAGLAGAILLGPRIGRYVNGKSVPMPGHNIIYAGLGVFLLWVGWYGFNPGSQLTYATTGEISHTVYIAVTTTMGGAAGALSAMFLVWIMFGKPDVSMMLNGILAGLVGVTANCNNITIASAVIIGAIAGVIVVLAIILLDKLKIDDPVGAFPVHGMCGLWGGIATGIFGVNIPAAFEGSRAAWIKVQLIGSFAIIGWAFGTMIIVFGILKVIGLLRVSPEHELEGLDISEHGMHAYPPSWIAADDFGVAHGAASSMALKTAPAGKAEVVHGNA